MTDRGKGTRPLPCSDLLPRLARPALASAVVPCDAVLSTTLDQQQIRSPTVLCAQILAAMSSSKSRSTSVEIVPPAGSRPMDLAGAINGALANNGRDDDRDDDFDPEMGPDHDREQAPSTSHKLAASPTAGNAPIPCERCMRGDRVCKGVAGARCEYCKRLKQKCTNSSGPARGKNAAAAKKAVVEASKAPSSKAAALHGPPTVGTSKRKQPEKALVSPNGGADGASVDGDGSILEDDDHELPPRLNKKRRISTGNRGPSRSELQKAVADMDASIKRIQTSVAQEVDKMKSVVRTLNAAIAEMESD